MKSKLFYFMLLFSILACKNGTGNKTDQGEFDASDKKENTFEAPVDIAEREQRSSSDTTSNKAGEEKEADEPKTLVSGTYIKTEYQGNVCSCYCLDIQFTGTSELCLSKGEIFINAKFVKSGDSINVMYINPSQKNTDKKLPWKDFSTDIPIAVIYPKGGGMELDWKGFSIDQEIAVDYAIYGKKTLEGSYRKK